MPAVLVGGLSAAVAARPVALLIFFHAPWCDFSAESALVQLYIWCKRGCANLQAMAAWTAL
jgi:hypothetical protein